MDPKLLNKAFDKFEALRVERYGSMQELAASYEDATHMLADIANMAMMLYVAIEMSGQVQPKPKSFKSDSAGFKSDTT